MTLSTTHFSGGDLTLTARCAERSYDMGTLVGKFFTQSLSDGGFFRGEVVEQVGPGSVLVRYETTFTTPDHKAMEVVHISDLDCNWSFFATREEWQEYVDWQKEPPPKLRAADRKGLN
jgi:hypothetical protein